MGKGNGSTRASASSSPRGLNGSQAQVQAPTYRISDIPADQLGYGGLTRDNSTYSKKDRDAYIEKNYDSSFANIIANKVGGTTRMGDIVVTATRGQANEFGISRMTYTFSDSYGHNENAQGWSSDIDGTLRKGLEKFLKAWPQRK